MTTLSEILEELRSEKPDVMLNGRPKGKCCTYCKTALAVTVEEPTIVHIRNPHTNNVEVKCLYHGKFYCRMCHKYQA